MTCSRCARESIIPSRPDLLVVHLGDLRRIASYELVQAQGDIAGHTLLPDAACRVRLTGVSSHIMGNQKYIR